MVKNSLLHQRVGVIVGSRVSKYATKRNSIRRAMYRGAENIYKTATNKPPRDILIIAKDIAGKIGLKEIKKEVEATLVNIND